MKRFEPADHLHYVAHAPDRLLLIPAVAELLAVSPWTARVLVRTGRLVRADEGRTIRVPASAVERYIRETTRLADAPKTATDTRPPVQLVPSRRRAHAAPPIVRLFDVEALIREEVAE